MQKSSYLYTSQWRVWPASVWQWSKLPSYYWTIANRKRNTTLVSVRQFSGDYWQSTSTTLTNIVSGDYFCVGRAMSYFLLSVIKSLIGRRSVPEQRIVRLSIYARRVKYRSTLNDHVTTGCQEKVHVDKGHQQISAGIFSWFFIEIPSTDKKNRSAFVIFTDITCTIIGKALSSYHWALKCSRRPIHVVFGVKYHCFYQFI